MRQKNGVAINLRLSFNMTGTSETNFPQNLQSTDAQSLSLCKTFANNSVVNVRFSISHN